MTTNIYSRETSVHNGKATTKTARPQTLQERPSTWLHTWPTKVWRPIEPGRTNQDCPRTGRMGRDGTSDGGNQFVAAELLWRALAHCLITIAMNEGVPHDSGGATPPALLPRAHQAGKTAIPSNRYHKSHPSAVDYSLNSLSFTRFQVFQKPISFSPIPVTDLPFVNRTPQPRPPSRTHQAPVSIRPYGRPPVGQRQSDLPLAVTSFAGSPPDSGHAAGPPRCGSWGRRIP